MGVAAGIEGRAAARDVWFNPALPVQIPDQARWLIIGN